MAVGHGLERREVATLVALQAVAHVDGQSLPRRRPRHVVAGHRPRRDVAAVHRDAGRPVAVLADGCADREEGDPRGLAERDELAGVVVGGGRQQVELAVQRIVGEQGRGQARRRSEGAADELDRVLDEPVVVGQVEVVALEIRGRRPLVLEDAALDPPEAPRHLALVARRGRGPAVDRADAGRQHLRRGIGAAQGERRGRAALGADVDERAADLGEALAVGAHDVRVRAAAASGGTARRDRSPRTPSPRRVPRRPRRRSATRLRRAPHRRSTRAAPPRRGPPAWRSASIWRA